MISKNALFLLLSIIFSAALMFAFVELPILIDAAANQIFGFPGFDQGISELNSYKSDLFISEFNLRLIGYICLALIILFIAIGFIAKKSSWAWVGALGLFLPVFGQFALSMFFLSGLSVLRVIWFPFMDISFDVLSLGNIVHLPYEILLWFFGLFNLNAHSFLIYFFMISGSLLFVWGVMVWFQTRFEKKEVAVNLIYKISRHPQYLGWIIWSYGLMLYSSGLNQMKKSWMVPSSLPWLIAAMVIIAICLIEEIRMKELHGEEYESYRRRTPFLFPIPKWFKSIIKAPFIIIFKKEHPERKREVLGITTFYTIVFILLSFLRSDLGKTTHENAAVAISNPTHTIDSLLIEIELSSRRNMQPFFNKIEQIGEPALEPLCKLLENPNPDIREFAAQSLGKMKAADAVEELIMLINDSNYRVSRQAVQSLAKIGDQRAEAPLIEMLNMPIIPGLRNAVINALADFKSEAVWDLLTENFKDQAWYNKAAALNSMYRVDKKLSLPFFIEALNDSNYKVRRETVNLILQYNFIETKEALKKVLDDEDFETRFYAGQALKIFEEL